MRRAIAILTAVALLALVRPALAACDEDTIDTISDEGDLIVLDSGDSYDVDLGDEGTALGWSEGDDVLVCDATIVNKDEDGERVSVSPH